mgnify:CR=1 FL=1
MSAEEGRAEEAEETEEATESVTEERERGAAEEGAPAEYRLGSPELIEAMLNAFDVLEKAAQGEISVSEAKALIYEGVEELLRKAGEAVRKRSRRRAKKTAEKRAKKGKKQAKGSKRKAAS